MTMSLLYALLGVNDPKDLEDQEKQSAYQPCSLCDTNNRQFAIKYYKAVPNQKKKVREALYDSLYHMLEYSPVNRTQSMAIGKLLCNALQDEPIDLKVDVDVKNLYKNLRLRVTEAIEENIP